MSIESADNLRKLIDEGQLVITPLLDVEKQLHRGSASIDLRLGTRFIASRKGQLTYIDGNNKDFDKQIANLQDTYYVRIGDFFVLHPGHFVLAGTLEYIGLPSNLAGNVITRSSWGRYGLIIATAIGIHPNFKGILTLELRNLADIPLRLYPGRRILQVFFHEVSQPQNKEFDPSAYLVSTKPGIGNFLSEETEIESIKNYSDYQVYPFSQ